jgi:hypothetical protein
VVVDPRLAPAPPALPGDYNQDRSVDAADYVLWRRALGTSVAAYSGADGSGNGIVDQADHGVWQAHFGQTMPSPAVASAVSNIDASAYFLPLIDATNRTETFVNRETNELIAAAKPGRTGALLTIGRDSFFRSYHPGIRSTFGKAPTVPRQTYDLLAALLIAQSGTKMRSTGSNTRYLSQNEDASCDDASRISSVDQLFALSDDVMRNSMHDLGVRCIEPQRDRQESPL